MLWHRDECALLPCFNAKPDIFAVLNCCIVALSVFSSDIVTWSADSLYSVQWHIRRVRMEEYAYIWCQQTLPKRWFANMNITSNCDVTNSPYQIQTTTIRHWMKPPHENFLRTPLLRKFPQWPWIKHPTFQLGGGHFTSGPLPPLPLNVAV